MARCCLVRLLLRNRLDMVHLGRRNRKVSDLLHHERRKEDQSDALEYEPKHSSPAWSHPGPRRGHGRHL